MKHIIVLLVLILSLNTLAQENLFRVMSYNIRYAGDEKEDGENAWSKRKDMVAKMIRFNKADIIGTQEALHKQLLDLTMMLKDYKWTGIAREDGKKKGEYSAILYNKNKFEKLDGADFWLSETPEIPSKGWDAAYERIVTWAKFKDKNTGKIFFVFNTHFDHMGEKAKEESSRLILKKINSLTGNSPVIVMGDFNCTAGSPPYKVLTEGSDNLKDAEFVSENGNYGTDFTYNDWGQIKENKEKIDFIFTKNNINVYQHGVIGETFDGKYPSDHMPVVADILVR